MLKTGVWLWYWGLAVAFSSCSPPVVAPATGETNGPLGVGPSKHGRIDEDHPPRSGANRSSSGRAADAATVSYVGSIGVFGCTVLPLDTEIRAVTTAQLESFQACVAAGGVSLGNAPLSIVLWMTVGPDGTVAPVNPPSEHPNDLGRCFASAVEQLIFEPPGAGCHWTHQLEFQIDAP